MVLPMYMWVQQNKLSVNSVLLSILTSVQSIQCSVCLHCVIQLIVATNMNTYIIQCTFSRTFYLILCLQTLSHAVLSQSFVEPDSWSCCYTHVSHSLISILSLVVYVYWITRTTFTRFGGHRNSYLMVAYTQWPPFYPCLSAIFLLLFKTKDSEQGTHMLALLLYYY